MKYTGDIWGFKYEIELESDEEFEIWLEAKLRRYLLPDGSIQKKVIIKILGLNLIEEKVKALETKANINRGNIDA